LAEALRLRVAAAFLAAALRAAALRRRVAAAFLPAARAFAEPFFAGFRRRAVLRRLVVRFAELRRLRVFAIADFPFVLAGLRFLPPDGLRLGAAFFVARFLATVFFAGFFLLGRRDLDLERAGRLRFGLRRRFAGFT
jgi:hypothetical protein